MLTASELAHFNERIAPAAAHARRVVMTKKEILTRAAAILKEDSESLYEACTLDGEWVIKDETDRVAKAEHDELIELSSALLAMAGEA